MVSALHRMLLRDLWHLRGQAVAAVLVVARRLRHLDLIAVLKTRE